MYLRDGLCAHFVAFVSQTLDHLIIAVLVRNEESPSDVTSVGILALLVEHFSVVVVVVQIYSTVES
jgi:hypothetical protein